MKILLSLLFLCIISSGAVAQSEDSLYYAAQKSMWKGKKDSTLNLLGTLISKYGNEDTGLYASLMINPTFRSLHTDDRWGVLMDSLLIRKHSVEDNITQDCPQKPAAIRHDEPKASHYEIDLDIDVSRKLLSVKATVDVDFHGKRFIDFALWKYSNINYITYNRHTRARYVFDADSATTWIEQAGRLRVYAPERGVYRRISFAYTCNLDSLDSWMSACDTSWVQLGYYMAWYPLNTHSEHTTGNLRITIDKGYILTGSGIVTRHGNTWFMKQPWAGYDFTVAASPHLKRKIIENKDRTIEIDYTDFPETDADSIANCCNTAFDYYSRLFGTAPDGKLLKLIILNGYGGAFSRKNFITAYATSYNEGLHNLLGHEIGHFWWHSAPTDNWNDWLNESFAEFSKLCLIGHDYGDTVLKDYICSYREITLKQCPIYNLDRNAEGSHAVFYQKGALILYDLWQQVGSKAFFLFMQSVADKHVSNNEQLIQQADLILGKHWGKWIMERLKQ